MWLERIRLKRRLASSDALVRVQAVAALDLENDRTILLSMAADDIDAQVRAAAISRCCDPGTLMKLYSGERDPHVQQLIARRMDQLYGEQALRACAEGCDCECDAFDRIRDNDVLIDVALRSNSPTLVLAAGARLAPATEVWLKLLEQLSDDRLAMELYQRNTPDPESEAALRLLSAARSRALREAIGEARAQQKARAVARAEALAAETALVEAAENCAERATPEEFEQLCARYRALPAHSENLKTRFMAARYRFFCAQEQQLANREAETRERQLAAELTARLESLKDSGNWKLIRQVIESWNRSNLNSSAGAAEYVAHFNALAGELSQKAQILQQAYSRAVQCAQKVLGEYQNMLQSGVLPPAEQRQVLLEELETAAGNLAEQPADFITARETVWAWEREFRRQARQAAQERDLARWEHFTLKMDLCAELEKLSAVPDEQLGEAARSFRSLRERWNAIGPVPNEKFEELRERYHAACSTLHGRLEQFFAERNLRQQQALDTKNKLLAEAETLAASEDWNETAARLKELQNMWKSAGSAGGKNDRELFEKFHAACDSFFVRRNAVWEERKRAYQAAADRKRQLCNAAEELKKLPFQQAKSEIAALREAWRSAPSAGKDDRLLAMEFNRIIESIFAAHREAGDEARRRSEIICTELGEVLEKARSNSMDVHEIERLQQQNQQQWEALDFRPAADVLRRRNKIAAELQNVICAIHHQEAMHKLDNAEQLESVIDPGDDTNKLIDHLGRRLKVCGELEDRLRECRIISGGGDLAGELQQAFAGNFGGDDYKLTVVELDEFLRRFVAVGQVPPDAREAVFDRFRTLYNRALTELQKNEESATAAEE